MEARPAEPEARVGAPLPVQYVDYALWQAGLGWGRSLIPDKCDPPRSWPIGGRELADLPEVASLADGSGPAPPGAQFTRGDGVELRIDPQPVGGGSRRWRRAHNATALDGVARRSWRWVLHRVGTGEGTW